MKKPASYALVLALVILAFIAGLLLKSGPGDNGRAAKAKNPAAGQSEPAGGDSGEMSSAMPAGTVWITPKRQQMIGVTTGRVEKSPLIHKSRLLGRVTADETRIYVINATVDGWITKTYPNTTGSYVKKDEVLATFYSPEFLSAVQAMLFALNAMDRVQTSGGETPAQKDQLAQFNLNLKQYRDSLRNLGMGELQIRKMIETRQWIENVDITSPASGFVLVRNVSDGLRFDKGTEMYRIADLGRVWILADVFESEAQFFGPGTTATVILPYQKKTFQATVSSVLPVFDASSRTLKVRLEADNPRFALRPDMFVDVELPVTLPPAVAVPADAILFSGLRKIVFVDRGNGLFEPRAVETGWRLGDRVEITRGLESGERIVLSGNFFIDSESRLQAAAQGIYGEASRDPVCGTIVDEVRASAAGLTSVHEGKTYYFCSAECKARFDKNPGQFAGNPVDKGHGPEPPPFAGARS